MRTLLCLVIAAGVMSSCSERARPPSAIDGRWTDVRDPDCSERGLVTVIDGIVFGIEAPGAKIPLGKIVAIHHRTGGFHDMEVRLVEKGRLGQQLAERPTTLRFELLNPARLRVIQVSNQEGVLERAPQAFRENLDFSRCPAG